MSGKDFPSAPPHPSVIEKDPSVVKTVDERLSYDQENQQWLFEIVQSDKTVEYTYNFIVQQWVPRLDTQVQKDEDEAENKQEVKKAKREKIQAMKDEIQKLKDAEGPSTSSVFVSNLPSDITVNKIHEIFSKYGVIAEDFKDGRPRIKLYYENEKFKSEALITYQNKESVRLAVDMLDDSKIRHSPDLAAIKVEPAIFNGDKNTVTAVHRLLTTEEKQLLYKKKQLLKKKVSGWDDEDPSALLNRAEQIRNRIWKKSLVIENMFRTEDFAGDKHLLSDIKEDIRSECDKYGIGSAITNIIFFDLDRIVLIRFDLIEAANQFRSVVDGRYYDGLKLSAHQYGGEKFATSERELAVEA